MRQLREQLDEVPEPEKKRTKPEKRSDPIKNDTTLSRSPKYGLGQKVSIYWPEMKKWYKGKITHVDPDTLDPTVTYEDGEELTYPPDFQGWKIKTCKSG